MKLKPRAKPVALSLYFGIPGAGKSTYAAYLAKKDMKKGRKVWSNFGITGALKCEKSDFGKYMMCDGRLIIDEAGLEYDNRKMSMTNDEVYFFKYHRHYQLDVDFFSQGLDVDIKIRKLARHIYLIKPSLLSFFIKRKEIGRKVGINDMTKEICDEYFFVSFLAGGTKLIFCPPLWKLFNTLSRKPLPEKAWETWKSPRPAARAFPCPPYCERNREYTNIPPVPAAAVFTHGKSLSANLVPIAPQPRRRLMFLRERPALALLSVPAL